jgi:hypothetical protein
MTIRIEQEEEKEDEDDGTKGTRKGVNERQITNI